nr:polysaccharide pyruvyl transferase family protein [Thiomicrorhabdus sp. Kp2]
MVMKNLETLLKQQGVEVLWTWPVSVDWRTHKEMLFAMPKVDAVIVNGEGTIHHGPRRWQAQALAEFADYAHNVLHLPAFLINTTLYANEDSLYEYIKRFNRIYVRDRSSFETLQTKQIESQYVPDMTFALKPNSNYQPSKELLVVDSVMQTDVPKLKEFSKKNQADYCSMIVARPSNYSFWKRPRRFLIEIFKWAVNEKKRSLNPSDFEAQLATYRLIVTGRYHTVTMCLKNRIPFVALESNTPKISFLLKEVFGDTHRVISSDKLESLEFNEWNSFSKAELLAIDLFIEKAINMNAKMIEEIVNDID